MTGGTVADRDIRPNPSRAEFLVRNHAANPVSALALPEAVLHRQPFLAVDFAFPDSFVRWNAYPMTYRAKPIAGCSRGPGP